MCDREYPRYWDDIIFNPDGSINIDQVKKELSDYSFLMEQASKVYCYVTHGKMSKLNYKADTIIAEIADYITKTFIYKEDLRRLLDE